MPEFVIYINDNDSFMCSSADEVLGGLEDLPVCESCLYRTDLEYINKKFKLRRKAYDLSSTYDGYYIASLKFKELIEREKIKGVELHPLDNEPEYFALFVRNVVKFDTHKRGCKSENFCLKCGSYESFVGSSPTFIKEPLPNDLCRSDVVFGSGNEKSPLLLASQHFLDLVKREKLKGISFEQVRT
ncbi:hypothetical protein V8063_004815 [Vibrio parahaemolyticus]|uniref:hypothetical protein n=1 Tax=Vibrio vulnificus TaxID=672 RepID=UPI00102981DD|nr:hypothetical protein [Vibrio vulnificus]RZP54088.1 hypothetical protein D8T48_21020 [Vibrio vulnificus]